MNGLFPLLSAPWRAELRATLLLGVPLALANLLQMLTYAVDVIFIARLGETALAASALAVSLFGLVMWALSALTGAVAPIISAALGEDAGNDRGVRHSVRMALWLAVLSGAGGMGVCLMLGPVMRLTGQESEVIRLAELYNLMLVWSLVPMLLANVLRNFVSALSRPLLAAAVTAGGIAINALGNYAFIFGRLGAPALGLQGAAIATIITGIATVCAYALAIRLDTRLHGFRILERLWQPDWKRLRQLLAIGTPIALTVVAEAGIFGAAAFLMGRLGATQLAAHMVALQIASLAFQVPFGIGQAATIRVGYFYGARDREGMARAGWIAIALGTGFMVVTALAMILAPHSLLRIYIDPDSPANAALVLHAVSFLAIGAAFQLFDGVQTVAASALRGLHDTRIPMWIAAFSYWVAGIGTALLLGFATPLEGKGVWIGLAIGLMLAAFMLIARWMRRDALGLTRR